MDDTTTLRTGGDLLSMAELSRRLGVHRSTVYRLLQADQGFPGPVRVGPHSPRWRWAEVDTWLSSRRPTTADHDAEVRRLAERLGVGRPGTARRAG